MNRKNLIALAVKYDGNYRRISKAIVDREDCGQLETDAITILDDDYPSCFLELKSPPLVLFFKGNPELLKRKEKIAVVGSRVPCEYAVNATKLLVTNSPGRCIVSGLAKGIDAIAHENAKESIGILGCGINYCYPYCNRELIERMSREQLVISEYPGEVRPYSYNFPFRNRLIAALADDVYIMQSRNNSGTMTTVNEALELGRNVKVLPYKIFDEEGKGNLELLSEGAQVIDIKEIFGLF